MRRGAAPLRVAIGVGLVVIGFVVFVVLTGDLATLGRSLLGARVVVVGVALLVGPWVGAAAASSPTSAGRASAARSGRDRRPPARLGAADARADPAPRRRRARGGGPRPAPGARAARVAVRRDAPGAARRGLARRARGAAADVEDVHGVRGRAGRASATRRSTSAPGAWSRPCARRPSTPPSTPASTRVDVYVEVDDERVEAFVRDRGRGFDPDAVPADRRGVARQSIVGRGCARPAARRRSRAPPGDGHRGRAATLPRRRAG